MQAQYESNLIYREQDASGDWIWGNGMNDMLSGQAAMQQVILTRLRAIKFEWWEGDSTALPYYTEILGGPGSMSQIAKIDLMVIARLMDTIGVISVTEFTSSFKNRMYHCSCNAHAVYGDILVREVTL